MMRFIQYSLVIFATLQFAVAKDVTSGRITWKLEYAGPTHLFSLPHRAHAVAVNVSKEGLHTYSSVIRLLQMTLGICTYDQEVRNVRNFTLKFKAAA